MDAVKVFSVKKCVFSYDKLLNGMIFAERERETSVRYIPLCRVLVRAYINKIAATLFSCNVAAFLFPVRNTV